jgi:NADPH:quinone reductase-like Zn-dependent oxidoreductase
MDLKLPVELPRASPNLSNVRAVVIEQSQLRVLERPDPVAGPDQVLIATAVAGLNGADMLQRRGHYPAPPGWPADVPGMELSGTVLAVGADVDPGLVGRRVCAIVGGGAQATRVLAPAAHLFEVPASVDLAAAGGFAEAFVTAYDALVLQGRLTAGERLLVSGASGGVGNAAVQIGHLLGAHVTAVTRHAQHHAALRDLGADEVVTVEDVSGLDPVDVVIELVGAAHLSLALRRLAPFARVVVIGVAGGGSTVELNLLALMGTRATLTGSTLRSRSSAEKAQVIARVAAALLEPWATGRLSVPVAASFELDDVTAAYDYFSASGKFGKVLLAMPEES